MATAAASATIELSGLTKCASGERVYGQAVVRSGHARFTLPTGCVLAGGDCAFTPVSGAFPGIADLHPTRTSCATARRLARAIQQAFPSRGLSKTIVAGGLAWRCTYRGHDFPDGAYAKRLTARHGARRVTAWLTS